ncbi:YheC/YheD family protein [Sporosarcina jiandibaonis]|uniref:YheC/YheD family endospore coat-associated protein n=1 Tax=Sporosarcina jiandibaonis TaxID=2715535 RepID=UPI001552C2F5|nr:YheC/YheD family protein [Sporosarcina jiandibaonis]
MVIVGMLHYRKHPRKVKKAYTCAAVAKMEGIEFYYFSPNSVRFEEKIIYGYVFENGNWIQKEMAFPDVIYNASGMKTAAQKKLYHQLKKIIPFTSHPIGNKMKVYRKIKEIPEFAHYLIPSENIKEPQAVFEALDEFNKVIVKPLSGSQGRGVMYIEKNGDKFDLVEGSESSLVDVTELHSKIKSVIEERAFLVQPYISSRTKDGLPFDFRIHVQKNGSGEWVITLIYPRIGSDHGIISNVSSGGYIGKLESFLDREYGSEGYDMKKILEHFAIRFSRKFDNTYKSQLDELGIDIGIDENKKPWIYEVNWRPGSVYRGLDAAMNTIPYAAYLGIQNKKGR